MEITPAYKLMSGESHHLKGLRENTVWFSSIDQLNDPYEGRISFEHVDVSLTSMKSALTHVYSRDNKDLKKSRKEVDSLFKKLGEADFIKHIQKNVELHFTEFLRAHHEERHILSLSKASSPLTENSFPEPLSLMMMWAHYANGFRGMCIEYDYHTLINSINDLNGIKVEAREVEYIEGDLPIIKSITVLDDLTHSDGNTSKEILRAYCTKHKAWAYENEVRAISPIQGRNKYSEESINRVFVSELNQTLLTKVKSILREKKPYPELFEVSLHKKKFGFFFRKIDY
ncbi:DUF2971 domain-containing protein [Vibrio sp. F13]|uniref:DUF2971 domain-containing protein n=1 Tax=Vibrio sp. F13 TaxID=2070777 RepID=UPI0010BDB0BD|nr:DUF2971 domain-containing protein [Vibrio sp. F13]TKF99563.1 DUF2971 domain-containing protein [Vibrio sp. F13]